MERRLGIKGFWVRALVIWLVVTVLTIGLGMLFVELPTSFRFTCRLLTAPPIVSACVSAVAAPFLYSIYVRRLRDFGQGSRLVQALLIASALYYALALLSVVGCEETPSFPGITTPIYAEVARNLSAWFGELVSLGWLALTLYAGVQSSKMHSA